MVVKLAITGNSGGFLGLRRVWWPSVGLVAVAGIPCTLIWGVCHGNVLERCDPHSVR